MADKRAPDDSSMMGNDVSDAFDDPSGPMADLELDTGGAGGATAGSTEGLGHQAFGDDWGENDGGGSAALDVDDPRQPAKKGSAPEAPRGRSAKPAEPAAVTIDPYEVKALADYGPEPKNVFESNPYAARVLRR